MDETNQHLALELWGRKWNLIIWGVNSYVKDKRFESPRGTLHLVQAFLHETLGYKQEEIDSIQFAAVHRLKFGSECGKDIIVRLVSLIDRDEMLMARARVGFQCSSRFTSFAFKIERRTASLSFRDVGSREKEDPPCLSY